MRAVVGNRIHADGADILRHQGFELVFRPFVVEKCAPGVAALWRVGCAAQDLDPRPLVVQLALSDQFLTAAGRFLAARWFLFLCPLDVWVHLGWLGANIALQRLGKRHL